jgi:PAS domain S-box-containing protein
MPERVSSSIDIDAAGLAEAADVALVLVDRGGRPVLVNRAARQMAGCGDAPVTLRRVLAALFPSPRERRLALPALRDALLGARIPVRIETLAPDGERSLLTSIGPYRAQDGRIHGALIMAIETGELRVVQHRLEQVAEGLTRAVEERTRELARSERKYREFFDAGPDAYIALDRTGRIEEINRTALRMTGFARADVLGRRAARLIPPAARVSLRAAVAAFLRDGAVENFELTLPRRDGNELTVVIGAVTIEDDTGATAGARVVLRDITHRVALEKQIAALDRLAATGQLAAGVAHEINNPLQAVVVHLDILRESLPADFAERDSADRVAEGVRRIQQIVRDLLDLHRGSADEHASIDINDVVREALGLVTTPLRHRGLAVNTDLALEVPPVRGNARHLYQVVLNLLLNAMHATPRGGSVTVRTRHVPGADQVQIDIVDTGPGIPEELLAHIFDPFHGTRKERGTGLGLFVTYGLVRQHGGTIEVDSRPARGSTFKVLLPRRQPPAAVPGVPPAGESSPR